MLGDRTMATGKSQAEATKGIAPRPEKVAQLRQALFENLATIAELKEAIAGKYPNPMRTIRHWRHKGGPFRLIDGRLYVDPKELALWLKRTGRE
jgi:hypothetical protein